MEWVAFFLAPLAAAIQIGVGYALVKPACAAGDVTMLIMLSAGVFTASVAGAGLGWWRRMRFVGQVALGLNLIVACLAIASTIALFVLSSCE